jgi:hypothetical protein
MEPATCGAAMEVPSPRPYSSPGSEERTSTPGADTSGLRVPLRPWPREENSAISWSSSYAPTAITFSYTPGVLMVRHAGPLLPAANTGMMPEACHRSTTSA